MLSLRVCPEALVFFFFLLWKILSQVQRSTASALPKLANTATPKSSHVMLPKIIAADERDAREIVWLAESRGEERRGEKERKKKSINTFTLPTSTGRQVCLLHARTCDCVQRNTSLPGNRHRRSISRLSGGVSFQKEKKSITPVVSTHNVCTASTTGLRAKLCRSSTEQTPPLALCTHYHERDVMLLISY